MSKDLKMSVKKQIKKLRNVHTFYAKKESLVRISSLSRELEDILIVKCLNKGFEDYAKTNFQNKNPKAIEIILEKRFEKEFLKFNSLIIDEKLAIFYSNKKLFHLLNLKIEKK